MKILYVANDRAVAQLAANALRDIAPDVWIAWAGSLSAALRWVSENRDVAVLLLEAEVQNQGCAPLVTRVRDLGLVAPVIVVASAQAGTPIEALRAGADDYVVDNQSLLADLPGIVRRALQRVQATAAATKKPLRLMYVGDAALAQQCLESRAGSIEIIEATPGPNGRLQPVPQSFPGSGSKPPFDILLVEHDHPGVDAFGILKDIADRGLPVPVILVVEWDEKLAVPAFKLGAMDCVVKSADVLRALFVKLDRTQAYSPPTKQHAGAPERAREGDVRLQASIEQERAHRQALEAKLAHSEAARRDAEQRLASERAGSAAQLAQRQAQYDAGLAQAAVPARRSRRRSPARSPSGTRSSRRSSRKSPATVTGWRRSCAMPQRHSNRRNRSGRRRVSRQPSDSHGAKPKSAQRWTKPSRPGTGSNAGWLAPKPLFSRPNAERRLTEWPPPTRPRSSRRSSNGGSVRTPQRTQRSSRSCRRVRRRATTRSNGSRRS